jgi:hypothetical protein
MVVVSCLTCSLSRISRLNIGNPEPMVSSAASAFSLILALDCDCYKNLFMSHDFPDCLEDLCV